MVGIMPFDDKEPIRIDEAKESLDELTRTGFIGLLRDTSRLSTSWLSKVTTEKGFSKFLDTLSALVVFGKNKKIIRYATKENGRLSVDVDLYKDYVDDIFESNAEKAIKKHSGSIIGLLLLYKKYAQENLRSANESLFGPDGIFHPEPDMRSVLESKGKYLSPKKGSGNGVLVSASNVISKLAKKYGVSYDPRKTIMMIANRRVEDDVYNYGRRGYESFAYDDLKGFEESQETQRLRKSADVLIENFKKQTTERISYLLGKVDKREEKYQFKWMANLDSKVKEKKKGRGLEDYVEERLVRLDKVEDIVLDLFTQSKEYLDIVNYIDTAGLAITLTLLKMRADNESLISKKNIIFDGIQAFRDKYGDASTVGERLHFDGDDDEEPEVDEPTQEQESEPAEEPQQSHSSAKTLTKDAFAKVREKIGELLSTDEED